MEMGRNTLIPRLGRTLAEIRSTSCLAEMKSWLLYVRV